MVLHPECAVAARLSPLRRWSEAAACDWKPAGDGQHQDLCIRCPRGKSLLRVRLVCSDVNAPLLAAMLEKRIASAHPGPTLRRMDA